MQHVVSDNWLIIGDFNLILQASDKSNSNLNRRLMGAFREVVRDLELKELNLRGRKFTWSNDRTQTRIDRAFCSIAWDLMMPNVYLQALSSKVSDHFPLLSAGQATLRTYTGFRFEAFWPKLPGYHDVVATAWSRQLQLLNPFLRLHTKLKRTSKALRRWAKSLIGRNKQLLKAASMLIGILDAVQDFRTLSDQEIRLKRDLKHRFLGLTTVKKLRVNQASRLTSIRASGANNKLFYLQANGRQRKNLIHSIHTNEGVCYAHEDKEAILFDHYNKLFGQPESREFTLNWKDLELVRRDLSHLEE
jgi:hypothetical protein